MVVLVVIDAIREWSSEPSRVSGVELPHFAPQPRNGQVVERPLSSAGRRSHQSSAAGRCSRRSRRARGTGVVAHLLERDSEPVDVLRSEGVLKVFESAGLGQAGGGDGSMGTTGQGHQGGPGVDGVGGPRHECRRFQVTDIDRVSRCWRMKLSLIRRSFPAARRVSDSTRSLSVTLSAAASVVSCERVPWRIPRALHRSVTINGTPSSVGTFGPEAKGSLTQLPGTR